VRLLLDEMISPAIARELRARGHDVDAVKRDRPELEGISDLQLVSRMTAERRAIATNDVGDFEPIHNRLVAVADEHYGMLFTTDATMPRNKSGLPFWVTTLDAFLHENKDDASMRNRIAHLP
jgi:uncharacterized protein YacL